MVASGAINLKNYKKWLKAIEPELKRTRATTGSSVAVVRYVLNIPQKKVTSTRWAFKEKSDRSSKARQAVLGWKQNVQNVLLGWIIGKNELKSTINYSKLYRACRARALSKLATL